MADTAVFPSADKGLSGNLAKFSASGVGLPDNSPNKKGPRDKACLDYNLGERYSDS